jgi:hypothetical protein
MRYMYIQTLNVTYILCIAESIRDIGDNLLDLAMWFREVLRIVYTSIYKTSECGKQLPNKAIYDGQIANLSVLRTDIAKSVKYTYGKRTHGFRDNTVC